MISSQISTTWCLPRLSSRHLDCLYPCGGFYFVLRFVLSRLGPVGNVEGTLCAVAVNAREHCPYVLDPTARGKALGV